MESKPYNIIKTIPFLACLSDEELSGMEQIFQKKHFSKNEIILLEEDTHNYMYIVYSGMVKVVQTSVEGKEQILAIRKKSSFFGEMSLLDGKTAPATVIAMEDSDVWIITKEDFEKYLLKNTKVLKEIVPMLCQRLREAWLMLKVSRFAGAEQRVRAILNLIGSQYGVKDMRGTIISLKLTHEDIAGYASVSRETVTRFISRFLKGGEVEILDNRYILLKPAFFKKIPIM
ncbi:MAG: Crp/Fnr family transcriptional regulator [Nitrospirae bacterium]|nr:Crp/Fnr family transcriptional regulator [Nitrospirota bacterium]